MRGAARDRGRASGWGAWLGEAAGLALLGGLAAAVLPAVLA
ncbi:MAG: hypothetical protein AAF763_14685 [Pseudomonadota bacterium]